jgi:hypothetical protein
MRKQIEQIMSKVESGDLAYHDAVDELLLLYNVSGSLCDYCKGDRTAVCCQTCLDEMINHTANTQ